MANDNINTPVPANSYLWDCIDSSLTELPTLVSWCENGAVQSTSHVTWDTISLLRRIIAIASVPDLAFDISSQIGGYDQFFQTPPGGDEWESVDGGDEWEE